MKMFEALTDFDPDGCSITLDIGIEELVNQDFNDHTTVLPANIAPIAGVGMPYRRPATAPNL